MAISTAAARNFIRVFIVFTNLLIQRKSGPPVLFEAVFTFIAANGPFLAITDGHHPVCRDSLGNQELFHGVCPAVTQSEVVLFASAFVAMALDGKPGVWIRFQPVGITLKNRDICSGEISALSYSK